MKACQRWVGCFCLKVMLYHSCLDSTFEISLPLLARSRQLTSHAFHSQRATASSSAVTEQGTKDSPKISREKLPKVVVVGSKVGSLATTARIASSSECQVTVLEKNSMAVGRCGSFHITVLEINGIFWHERGPSLLLLPQVYCDLFRDCGLSSEQNGLLMKQCVSAYQFVFDDGDRIELGYPRARGEEMSMSEKIQEQSWINLRKMKRPNGTSTWKHALHFWIVFPQTSLRRGWICHGFLRSSNRVSKEFWKGEK